MRPDPDLHIGGLQQEAGQETNERAFGARERQKEMMQIDHIEPLMELNKKISKRRREANHGMAKIAVISTQCNCISLDVHWRERAAQATRGLHLFPSHLGTHQRAILTRPGWLVPVLAPWFWSDLQVPRAK